MATGYFVRYGDTSACEAGEIWAFTPNGIRIDGGISYFTWTYGSTSWKDYYVYNKTSLAAQEAGSVDKKFFYYVGQTRPSIPYYFTPTSASQITKSIKTSKSTNDIIFANHYSGTFTYYNINLIVENGTVSVSRVGSEKYTYVTLNSGNGEYEVRVKAGKGVMLTATAVSEDYVFSGWSDGVTSPTRELLVNSDIILRAVFRYKYHTVNFSMGSSSEGHGNVGLRVAGEDVSSGVQLVEGTVAVAYCSPGLNYRFYRWLINDAPVSANSTYQFTVSGDYAQTINIVADVIESNTYSVSITKVNGGRGTISLTDGSQTWDESDDSIAATGHSGVAYTVSAEVTSAPSAGGRETNRFVGFEMNGDALNAREVIPGYEYEATFSNGQNTATETLGNVSIVATFAQKPFHQVELNIPVSAGGTATIEPVPDAVDPVNKWLEGSITAVATPNTGYYVGSFNVADLDYGSGGHVMQPPKDNDGKYRDSFTLNFNARITVNFLKIPCRPSVSVHTASAAVSAGSATVSSTAQGGGTDAMVYGDIAIFSATPASAYHFGGWFDADGNPAPDSTIVSDGVSHTYTYTDAEYRVALTSNLALVARFSAQVSLTASPTASASGTVSVDGETPPKWVLIGETCEIAATPGTSSYFGSWYLASDTSFESPLALTDVDTITVSNTISYVARFVSEQDALYVAMCNYDYDADVPDASLGNLAMTTSGASPVEAQTCSEADFLTATGLTAAPAGAVKFYMIPGTARMSIYASAAVGRGFNSWTLAPIVEGSEGSEVQLSMSAQTAVVVNRHTVLRAYWGDLRPSRVTLHFAIGSNVTDGNLKMVGIEVADGSIEDRTETSEETSATYTQGDVVAISVDIKNGYLFDGWYYDPECTQPLRPSTVGDETYEYTDAEYRFAVSSPVTICAKFVQDANAIYCWEGSADPKMMTWKSKVYVSSKPFDPVAVRVDSTGYADDDGNSLSVSVGMFSSPDALAKPSSVRTLQIRSQDSRRLPRMRPERYMQVQVDSNCEVDAMFVGTSMGGLAI